MPTPNVNFVALEDGLYCVTNDGTVNALNTIFDDTGIPEDEKAIPFSSILRGASKSGKLTAGTPGGGDVQKYFGIENGIVVLATYEGPKIPIRGAIPGIKVISV
jgi:hypothetical protein